MFLLFTSAESLAQNANAVQMSNAVPNTWDTFNRDLDSDGLVDIVISNPFGIKWSKNLGNGEFQTIQELINYGDAYCVVKLVEDFDVDGAMDILAVKDGIVVIFHCIAQLTYQEVSLFPAQTGNGGTHIINLNNDGLPDIVMDHDDFIHAYVNLDGLSFEQSFVHPIVENTYYGIKIKDLNQDGDEDIILTVYVACTTKYYESNGDGTFQPINFLISQNGGLSSIEDFNNDGILDLFFIEVTGNDMMEEAETQYYINIHFGQTGLMYDSNPDVILTLPEGDFGGIYILDWNNDEELDVIVYDNYPDFDNLENSYVNKLLYFSISPTNELVLDHSTEVEISLNREMVDFDNNGVLDFSGELIFDWVGCILRYDDDIDVVKRLDKSYGGSKEIFPFNLDNDLDKDLLVWKSKDGALSKYLYSNGQFDPVELILDMPLNNTEFSVLDIDSDGDRDLVGFCDYGCHKGYIWINQNNGFTLTEVNMPYEMFATTVLFGDLNADGLMDLVYHTFDDVEFQILLSTENTFFSYYEDNIFYNLNVRALLDMDLDGFLDVCVSENQQLVVFRNTDPSSLTFEEDEELAQNFTNSPFESYINYNNDGIPDLLFRDQAGTTYISVSGENGYEPLMPGPLLDDLYILTDLNGDGLTDYVLKNYFDDWALMTNVGGDFELSGVIQIEGELLLIEDFASTGVMQVVTFFEGQLYIEPLQIQPVVSFITGFVFLDMNQNGVYDEDENYLTFPVTVEAGSLDYTFSGSGQFYYMGPYDTGIITPQYDTSIWTLTTDSAFYTVLNDGEEGWLDEPMTFGFYPVGDNPHIGLGLEVIDFACNQSSFELNLLTVNSGNTIESGVISLLWDHEHFPILQSAQDYVFSGDTIYVTVTDLIPGDCLNFQFRLDHPGVDWIDSLFVADISYISENLSIDTYFADVITCAYDPNMIEVEPKGWAMQGFVNENEILTYTVHFQNLGSASAEDIYVEMQLSPNLNWQELNVVGYSHSMNYVVTENGYLRFDFPSIQLPTPIVSEPGSHGFVKFSIPLLPGLPHGTIVPAEASIYFDLNPAIHTNHIINTVMDCSVLQGIELSDYEVCAGEEIATVSTGSYIVDYTWMYNSMEVSHSSSAEIENQQAGISEVNCITSNPICLNNSVAEVVIHEVPLPVVTMESDWLTTNSFASYQWYKDGSPIAQGIEQSIPILANGDYQVEVYSDFGCRSLSPVFSHSTSTISCFPNPAGNTIKLQSPGESGTMDLIDISGRRVFTQSILHITTIDLSALSSGLYFMHIIDNSGVNQTLELMID